MSKADWLRLQAQPTLELSDEDLESVSGGTGCVYGYLYQPNKQLTRIDCWNYSKYIISCLEGLITLHLGIYLFLAPLSNLYFGPLPLHLLLMHPYPQEGF